MTRLIIRPLLILFCLAALPLLACGLNGRQGTEAELAALEEAEAALVSEPEVVTIIVVATETPAPEAPAEADVPVLEAPPAAPGEPTVTALVSLNVRRGPGTLYAVGGALGAGSSARVIGRSPDGGWWKIDCPPGAGAECWVSGGAQFSTAANVDQVPIAAVPPLPTHPPATAVAAAPSSTPTATLPPAQATEAYQATATAVATNPAAATQAAQPTATPTATTTAVQPTATATTAVIAPTPTATTAVIAPTATATTAVMQPTATATQIAPTATATTPAVPIAPFDNDSLQNPAVSVFFSPTGTRNFTHQNDVSHPNGDQDDWVRFEFPNASNTSQNVWITLTCNIQGSAQAQLRATIWVNNQATSQNVICNSGEQQLTVNNTQVQFVRVHFGITDGNNPIYAAYTLTVVGFR
jgi:uncharacterized protein YgiM (DUF1202 family)